MSLVLWSTITLEFFLQIFKIKLRDSLYDSLNSLFCGISGSLPRQWWYMPSLSPYSNKVLTSGAHRWETTNLYLQDIYCIVKPWIQRNKSISQYQDVHVWWMNVYDDHGENNGESLILLLLFWEDTYLSCTLKLLRRMRCSIFSFSFLSGGYLVPLILLSDTCPFLPLVSLFLFF